VATSVMFICSIYTPWAVVWGTVLVAIPLTIWFWPRVGETQKHLSVEKSP